MTNIISLHSSQPSTAKDPTTRALGEASPMDGFIDRPSTLRVVPPPSATQLQCHDGQGGATHAHIHLDSPMP